MNYERVIENKVMLTKEWNVVVICRKYCEQESIIQKWINISWAIVPRYRQLSSVIFAYLHAVSRVFQKDITEKYFRLLLK